MTEEMKDIQEIGEETTEMEIEHTETPVEESMESILRKYGDMEDLHRGKIISGNIVGQGDDGWLVDVGYKCEGFLPAREWSHKMLVNDAEKPEINDTVTVEVINVRHGEEAQLHVSRWRCEFDKRWNELEEKLSQKDVITVRGLRKVKGGLMVDCCSLEGFVPISHLAAEGRGVNPGKYVGEEFEVRLLEKDRRKRRLVLSRRLLLEQELSTERDSFYGNVTEGAIMEGTVSSITAFGVFVNLGPIDGLVHMSELSWKRNNKPKDLVKKGDTVTVKVIGIDRENSRISLSIKQTQSDPWLTAAERWKSGTRTTGVVTNVTDFGAFVEIEPGVEGLIHIGDLCWARIKHPKEILKKGQEVEVVVLDVDGEKRRISLGYKQLHDPWANIDSRFSVGQDITVKVVRLADFGAFVEIEEGVEALIHISQLSTKRVDKPQDVLAEGQEVVARVIEINPSERRMRLSLSALEEDDGRKRHEEEKKRRASSPKPEREKEKTNSYSAEEQQVTIGDFLKDSFKQ